MTELRPYQRKLLLKAERALAAPKARVMLQLPTGGGKTRIAAALLAGWIRGGGKAAWLTHRRELSDQTRDVLNNNGVRAANTLVWGVDDPAPSATDGVVIEMVQTVSRRNKYRSVWGEYGAKDLLVIDEAHHAPARGWERTIRHWPGPAIGLTATPWRIEKNLGFKHLFDYLILGPEIRELQAEGFLANARVWMPDSDGTILGGGLDSKGEYIGREIELANQGRPNVMTGGALEPWRTHAPDRQTIIYAVSKRHAENLAVVFRETGVRAAVILGDTPKDIRDSHIRQFSDGKLKVLINVEVATEGFDLPEASCVVLARPTMSLSLYLQMVGRGLRPKKGSGDCLILDLAGNVDRHGLPDADHHYDWSLEPRGRRGEGGSPWERHCPKCGFVSPVSSHNCRDCGDPFGKECQRCKWRPWKLWSAEQYCGDDHEWVCNLCHLDAHEMPNLPEGLKEMLRKELNESLTEVNPSSLHTLEDVQDRIYELAENLVHAKKIGDVATLNRMTEELKPLLKRDTQLKRARLPEVTPKLRGDLNEVFSKLGDEVTHLDMEYHDEKGVRITYRLNGGNKVVLNWLSWWDSMRPYIQD